ncbi:MAG TPA: OmpA family protein [Anaeromyxobacteraceae bacterium]|nr:OmpA family protein [Anaeromyxobacteraceae bacterium]
MRPRSPWLLAVLAAGCAAAPTPPAEPAGADAGALLRAPELARVRCLLVAPFENASDAPLAAEAATGALLGGIDPARTRVFPVPELRALFRDTPLELPEGVPPSLALELAQLLDADAALYGAVEGRTRDGSGEALVTLRIALAGGHDLLFADAVRVRAAGGETIEAAVRRAVTEAARPVLARLGAPGRSDCFPRERTEKLRALALADASATAAPPSVPAREPAPAPVPAPVASAAPAPEPAAPVTRRARPERPAPPAPAPAPATRSPRQAEWAKRLAGGAGRILVEDATFEGRTPALARDGGLADLALALLSVPGARVRIEAFVDASSDPEADARLSAEMAEAAVQRLVELGAPRARLSFAGRGGDSPILPNFTARGRAANRRIEAVPLK